MGAIILPASASFDLDGALDVSARNRQFIGWDEKKQIDRAAKILHALGLKMILKCGSDVCPDQRLQLVRDPKVETGAMLRCGCTDVLYRKGV